MNILPLFPPNIKRIAATFDLKGYYPVFTYGDDLFNPWGGEIPTHLMKHEETHSRQQARMGIEEWWDLYLDNKIFRLSQEVEAYHNQYEYFCKNKKDLYKREVFLLSLADDLSGPLYGNIVSKEEARQLILQGPAS